MTKYNSITIFDVQCPRCFDIYGSTQAQIDSRKTDLCLKCKPARIRVSQETREHYIMQANQQALRKT